MVTTANTIGGKISRLQKCRDFQRSPFRAVVGRLLWRLRWIFTNAPCRLRLGGEFEIVAPKTGSAGFIYSYGYSEPETARFVISFLKPGMVFWDVGAHIGEYVLLATNLVGEAGHVDAFEPQPAIFEYLSHNTLANKSGCVSLHKCAIADRVGTLDLSIHSDPSRSYLCPNPSHAGPATPVSVPATCLDEFYRSCNRPPNLIKVDVEGAERLVIGGAKSLLELPSNIAPVWLIEFDPQNCAKFDYHPREIIQTLHLHGYRTFWLDDAGQLIPSATPQPWEFGINLVADKREPQG
jgi:FkbM family methyltransferase